MCFAYVIETEFVPTLQDSGVEIEIVDNDRKGHSKTTGEAFENLGSKCGPALDSLATGKGLQSLLVRLLMILGVSPKFIRLYASGSERKQHSEE